MRYWVTPYELLYADVPSRFEPRDRKTGLGKSADRHYRTLSLEEMAICPVPVASNALLALWAYDPMLPCSFALAKSWGFTTFVTVLFRWLKTTKNGKLAFGTGYHTRGGGCEEVFLFKRGRGLPVLNHSIRKEFYSPRREHSRKPDEVPGWLVDLYGDVPRIELFARTQRVGWDAHGDQIDLFPSHTLRQAEKLPTNGGTAELNRPKTSDFPLGQKYEVADEDL